MSRSKPYRTTTIVPPFSHSSPDSIYLLDLRVGTAVEHQPRRKGTGTGAGGRRGAGVSSAVGTDLNEREIVIERVVSLFR